MSKYFFEMVNNIPSYYCVILLVCNNIGINGLKWPIHVVNYREHEWSLDIYEIQEKYTHPVYGFITVLINKNISTIFFC